MTQLIRLMLRIAFLIIFYQVIGTLTSSQQFVEPDFARSFSANIKPLNRLEGVRDRIYRIIRSSQMCSMVLLYLRDLVITGKKIIGQTENNRVEILKGTHFSVVFGHVIRSCFEYS